MFGLGPAELAIILIVLVVILIFSANRLPGAGKSIGQGLRGFKSGLKGEDDEDKPKEIDKGSGDDASDKGA